MKFKELPLAGAYLIERSAAKDERGKFERLYCEDELRQIDFAGKIVQINLSKTAKKGTVRGMHYQAAPHSEEKIVQCLRGSVLDVIVDLRSDSKTFRKWHAEKLSGDDGRAVFIPVGFAHGFQALEDGVEMLYFHTNFYAPDAEQGVRYDDPLLGIKFPLTPVSISRRDLDFPLLNKEASSD